LTAYKRTSPGQLQINTVAAAQQAFFFPMEVDGAPIADFNLSEGEKLRVVKVGTRIEAACIQVSKK
jgi:hypothetical protein